jgi:hypothetical protein
MRMDEGFGLRLITGALFLLGAIAFGAAAAVLSSTFDWPDFLGEPASVVLPAFTAGVTGLVWTWFATGSTYAILAVPILLLPAALGRRHDAALRVATFVGAASLILSVIGSLRWVFVVPPLARPDAGGDATTRAASPTRKATTRPLRPRARALDDLHAMPLEMTRDARAVQQRRRSSL